ncbi:hypothetical protein JCM6882_007377 [Rhodosporidiobolus microsporus]
MEMYSGSSGPPPPPRPTTGGLALPVASAAPPPASKKRRSTWMGMRVDGQPSDLGPGRRRGRVDYASLADGGDERASSRRKSKPTRAPVDESLFAGAADDLYTFESQPGHSRAPRSDSSYCASSPPPAAATFDFAPSISGANSGWTLADDVELVQLAQSFKFGPKGVNWVAVAGRFGGGLRRTSQECEKRWKALECEVDQSLFAAEEDDENAEEEVEPRNDDGWTPNFDAVLLAAIDLLSTTPIAAYASLNVLLSDPSESNYAATAWEQVADLFQQQVIRSSLVAPADVHPEALYLRHQQILHPSPPPKHVLSREQRRRSERETVSWSRKETSRLVEKVVGLGGRPAFRDAGWEEGVERTARWVQVGVAAGGGRTLGQAVGRWDEVRETVEEEAPSRLWTAEEDALLRRLSSEGVASADIASQVDRSAAAVEIRIRQKGLKEHSVNDGVVGDVSVVAGNRVWTTEDDEALNRLHQGGQSAKEIGTLLDRTECAVTHRIQSRQTAKKQARMPPTIRPATLSNNDPRNTGRLVQPYTPEEDRTLREGRLNGDSFALLAARLGRKAGALQQHWSKQKPAWEKDVLLPIDLAPSSSAPLSQPHLAAPSPLLHSSSATQSPAAPRGNLPTAAAPSSSFYPFQDPSTVSGKRTIPLSNKPVNLCGASSALEASGAPRSKPLVAPRRGTSASLAPPAALPLRTSSQVQSQALPVLGQQERFLPVRENPFMTRILQVLEENEDGNDDDE